MAKKGKNKKESKDIPAPIGEPMDIAQADQAQPGPESDKGGDKNQSQPQAGKQQKKKKAVVVREEHPGLIVPAAVAAAILLALGIMDKLLEIPRAAPILIGGAATVLVLVFSGVYYVKNYLRARFLKMAVILTVVVCLGCCGAILWLASWTSEPAAVVDLERANPNTNIDLSSGLYRALIQASFKEEDEKTSKQDKNFKLAGNYVASIASGSDPSDNRTFSGKFESSRQIRKMARRSRGYLEVRKTSDFQYFYAKNGGEYAVHLSDLASKLKDDLKIAFYASREWLVILLGLFGALCLVLANFIDHVIRSARIASAIGPAMGGALGFALYFYQESSPIERFNTMAMDIMIGGIAGSVVSYLIYMALKKWYTSIARSLNITV